MPRTRREGKSTEAVEVDGIAGDRLKSFIERVERLLEEKKEIAGDVSEVFAEAKAVGFSPKIMRKIIAERAMDSDDLEEEQTLMDVYRKALGMLPLFAAAEEREAEPDPAPKKVAPKAVAAEAVEEVVGKVALAAAEKRGREDFAAGASILKPPKFDSQQEEDAWGIGFNKAKKEKAAADAKEKDKAEATMPERQTAAKLAGEEAGARGALHTENPYAAAHPLYGWWSKGWKLGADDYSKKTPQIKARADAEKVTPIRRGKGEAGFEDKTPRLSAEQAAKLLGSPEGTS